AVPPSVLVRDGFNNPVAGVSVTFAVVSGGGSLTGATQTTNASGIATVGSWTLGTGLGTNTLTATSPGLTGSPLTFTATGTAGTTTQLTINAGNNQTGTAGTAVAIPPSVLVRDAFNNPVAGVSVTFAVASGGGSLTAATQTSNASGIATVGSWTLGTVAGPNTLTATSPGLTGFSLTFTATGTAGTATQLAINAGNNQVGTAGTAVPIAPSVLVRDALGNPVAGISVTFAVVSGGGSVTGATQTTNASGIATVGSWTLGTGLGTNTLTATSPGLTGSPLTFTATATAGVVAGGSSVVAQNGREIGPGSIVTITQTLTNSTSTPIASVYEATLPTSLIALSCAAPIGACAIGAGSSMVGGPSPGQLHRVSAANAPTTNRTITWNGTIPGNGSVTITYQVQVSVQVSAGTQSCITSTINSLPGSAICVTTSIPPPGPGAPPTVAGLPNQQKPGSVLIFSVYTSTPSRTQSDSLISLTNTNPTNPAEVRIFFVDGSNGNVSEQAVTLLQNQTTSFLTSDFDPGVMGYLIAVAVDQNGCPTIGNYLIGGSVVRFPGGHHANLTAIGVSGLAQTLPLCDPNSPTATIAFNGVAYDELPRSLATYTLPSLGTGNRPMLIINRIGGFLGGLDLSRSTISPISRLAGALFDDAKTEHTFEINGGKCQVWGELGNNFPRTNTRYTDVIPAGRTGWMKFWSIEDEAITGVLINESLSGLSGGYNLQMLTTTKTATLTITVRRAE
ncbi:MAG: hypothetical protein ACOYNR_11255, partial [Blastocatellia bacterium]